jgi:chemotaxis protein MotB
MSALDILQKSQQLGEEHDPDQEGWMVSYADLITLLFVFFAVMLSISSVSKAKLELLNHEINQEMVSSLSQIQQELNQQIVKQNLTGSVSTEITNDGLQIQFNEKVLFASGEAKVSLEGSEVLKKFTQTLAAVSSKFNLAVEGHTDSRPIHTEAYPSNWSLSSARAVQVLHFLTANGVNEKRMMVRAYSDTRPLAASASQPGLSDAANRRVTLLVF